MFCALKVLQDDDDEDVHYDDIKVIESLNFLSV